MFHTEMISAGMPLVCTQDIPPLQKKYLGGGGGAMEHCQHSRSISATIFAIREFYSITIPLPLGGFISCAIPSVYVHRSTSHSRMLEYAKYVWEWRGIRHLLHIVHEIHTSMAYSTLLLSFCDSELS